VILNNSESVGEFGYLFYDGRYVYAGSAEPSGFSVIDPSDPANPEIISSYNGITAGQRILVVSNIAYWGECCNPEGYIAAADVSNPTNIVELSRDGVGNSSPMGMDFDDGSLYVAIGASFRIYDANEPTNLTVMSTTGVAGYAQDIKVKDNYAYVVTLDNGLYVFSLSNLYSPRAVASLDLDCRAAGICLVSNYAYVSGIGGIQIVDISTPTNPVVAGAFLTNRFHELAFDNQLMYGAAGFEGIQILEVKTPTNLVFLAATTTVTFVRSVCLISNRVAAASPFTIAENRPIGSEHISFVSGMPDEGYLVLQWPSAPERFYSILSTTSLVTHPISWHIAATNLPATVPLNIATVMLDQVNMQIITVGVTTNP